MCFRNPKKSLTNQEVEAIIECVIQEVRKNIIPDILDRLNETNELLNQIDKNNIPSE